MLLFYANSEQIQQLNQKQQFGSLTSVVISSCHDLEFNQIDFKHMKNTKIHRVKKNGLIQSMEGASVNTIRWVSIVSYANLSFKINHGNQLKRVNRMNVKCAIATIIPKNVSLMQVGTKKLMVKVEEFVKTAIISLLVLTANSVSLSTIKIRTESCQIHLFVPLVIVKLLDH